MIIYRFDNADAWGTKSSSIEIEKNPNQAKTSIRRYGEITEETFPISDALIGKIEKIINKASKVYNGEFVLEHSDALDGNTSTFFLNSGEDTAEIRGANLWAFERRPKNVKYLLKRHEKIRDLLLEIGIDESFFQV